MDTFTIISDLLGILAFLSKEDPWFIRKIRDQIKPDKIENYLVWVAYDVLPANKRDSLKKHLIWGLSLSKEDEKYFRESGYCYGAIPKFPEKLISFMNEVVKPMLEYYQ